jgi:hypothetical protein
MYHVRSMDANPSQTTTRLSTVDCKLLTDLHLLLAELKQLSFFLLRESLVALIGNFI